VIGVAAAFDRAPIVALADAHRDENLARFRIALIQRPEFAAPNRDIVIEWGNARLQSVLDRYVAGGDVPLDSLRLVWRTALANLNGIFDSPVYEDFVVAMRVLNRTLAPNRWIRILGCDPPVDWETVRSRDDVDSLVRTRDQFCARLLEREILDRGRSAPLILGGGHVLRRGDTVPEHDRNVTELLDRRRPRSVFVVTTRRSRDADTLTRAWAEPSFVVLRGTPLGRDATETGPFETIADGFLLLSRGRDVEPSPAIYDGTTYGRELDRRWCLISGRRFPVVNSSRTATPSPSTCR
jgi:hypothetical protein